MPIIASSTRSVSGIPTISSGASLVASVVSVSGAPPILSASLPLSALSEPCPECPECPDIETPAIGSIVSSVTYAGRVLAARRAKEGLAYKVVGFRVGSGGYNPEVPTQTVAVDANAPELTGTYTFPELPSDPEEVDQVQYANDFAPAYLCRLNASEAVIPIGEWGLYVEITYSPEDESEVGTKVLYAVFHRPMLTKTNMDVFVCRLVNQL